MIYEDIFDAKTALEKLNGFQVAKRYLIVLYYQKHKQEEKQAQGAVLWSLQPPVVCPELGWV